MPAFLLNPLIRYGIIALVIAVLTGWAFMERNGRIAAAKGEAAARLESDLHAADAERWQAASGARDQTITQLTATLDQQSSAIEASRAAQARSDQLIREAETRNRQLIDQHNADIAATEEMNRAHPENDRPLGPTGLRYGKLMFARP